MAEVQLAWAPASRCYLYVSGRVVAACAQGAGDKRHTMCECFGVAWSVIASAWSLTLACAGGCKYRLRGSSGARRVWTGRQRLEAVHPTCSARTRRRMDVQGMTTVHYRACVQGTQTNVCPRSSCYLSRRGLGLRLSVDHPWSRVHPWSRGGQLTAKLGRLPLITLVP